MAQMTWLRTKTLHHAKLSEVCANAQCALWAFAEAHPVGPE
jgi:hypothetical protein